jgi:hypothetical protein
MGNTDSLTSLQRHTRNSKAGIILLSDKFASSKELMHPVKTGPVEQSMARDRMIKRMEQELALVAPSVEESQEEAVSLPEISHPKPPRPMSLKQGEQRRVTLPQEASQVKDRPLTTDQGQRRASATNASSETFFFQKYLREGDGT